MASHSTGHHANLISGAITGAVFNLVGSAFDALKSRELFSHEALAAAKVVSHGVVGGLAAQASGGKFESGFLSSGLSEFAGQRGLYGNAGGKGFEIATGAARAAVVGGAISEVSGGSFESGALNAALGRLFNETAHERANEKRELAAAGIDYRDADAATFEAMRTGSDAMGAIPGPVGVAGDAVSGVLSLLSGDFQAAFDSFQAAFGNEGPKNIRYMSKGKVLQTGGRTVEQRTADALNEAFDTDLHRREWGRALESMKKELHLRNDHHGKILSNGDYTDGKGNVLGNLGRYF